MKDFILFQSGPNLFGLEFSYVMHIYKADSFLKKQYKREPCTKITIQKHKTLLYDLSGFIRKECSYADLKEMKIIIFNTKKQILSILTDRMAGIASVEMNKRMKLPPLFKGVPGNCFPYIFKFEERLCFQINPEGIYENMLLPT